MSEQTGSNIFEQAVKLSIRFESSKGVLSTEDLWKLKLNDLDSIYKYYNKKLNEENNDSLLDNPKKDTNNYQLRIDIIKHIVKTKLAEIEANDLERTRKEKKRKILDIIESKKDSELQMKSIDELKKLLED